MTKKQSQIKNFTSLYENTRKELHHLNIIIAVITSIVEWMTLFLYIISGRFATTGDTYLSYGLRYIVIPQILMFTICALSHKIMTIVKTDRAKNFSIIFGDCLIVGVVVFSHYLFAVVLTLIIIPLFISTFFGDKKLVNQVTVSMLVIYIVALGLTPFLGDSEIDSSFPYNVFISFCLLIGINIICRTAVENESIKMHLYEKSRAASLTDSLTQLPNLAAINSKMEELKAKIRTYIAIIDIDNFKSVNDTYGHEAGNTAIKKLAELMNDAVENDPALFAGRFGGDEFIMMSSGIPFDEFKSDLQSICDRFKNQTFTDIPRNLTLSIGATTLRSGKDNQEIIADVDKYLYMSKEAGKDRITAVK